MVEKKLSLRVVFLLVLLVAVGIFLLYSRLTFTGFVTSEYFNGSATLNEFADNDSLFQNTKFDGIDAVVLDNLTLLNGSYMSPFFVPNANDTEVIWTVLNQNILLNPSTSSAVFYYRTCDVLVNCTAEFIPSDSNVLLMGKYFQYKVEMETSTSSPKLYGITVSYHTPLNLPISIVSPQNTTYSNETVPVEITAEGTVFWSLDNGNLTEYTNATSETLSEGSHVITAQVSDTHGNVNSTSVTFSVEFAQTFYEFNNNQCTQVNILPSQAGANDYATSTGCESQITTTTETSQTETQCTPSWQCDDVWTDCIDGVQQRLCTDTNSCGTTEGRPPTEQPCGETPVTTTGEATGETTVTPTETETPTPTRRGFLSIVGSAVTAPFTFVFSNKTRIFVFSAVLLLIIGGFLTFKFSVKTRLKILKLLNFRKRKAEN